MRNESACCKTKENRLQRRATSVLSARCWDSLEYVSDLCSTRLMASSLKRACTSEPTSPHVDIARGRREYVAGNEPRYLFFFRSTASARCFPTWRAAFPRLEPAQGLTMVMSSRSALFVCVCVYVCVCRHPIYSGRQTCGRTSWGHTGGRSYRISPPSFWGDRLNFYREEDSAIPFSRRP